MKKKGTVQKKLGSLSPEALQAYRERWKQVAAQEDKEAAAPLDAHLWLRQMDTLLDASRLLSRSKEDLQEEKATRKRWVLIKKQWCNRERKKEQASGRRLSAP